jgi:hypothetical protein
MPPRSSSAPTIHDPGPRAGHPPRQDQSRPALRQGLGQAQGDDARPIGAHTITIPARQALYLNEADRAEILHVAEDAFRAEADQASGARP